YAPAGPASGFQYGHLVACQVQLISSRQPRQPGPDDDDGLGIAPPNERLALQKRRGNGRGDQPGGDGADEFTSAAAQIGVLSQVRSYGVRERLVSLAICVG